MIKIRQKGDFSKVTRYLERIKKPIDLAMLHRYAKEGLAALQSATPVKTGLTASSWQYEIKQDKNLVSISYFNTNENNGVPIAIILQYGHGTGTGGWVQGVDYINPAIKPIFDKLASEAWREVTKV